MKVVRWIAGGMIILIVSWVVYILLPSDLTIVLALTLLLAYPVGRYLFLDTRKAEWRRARFVGCIGAVTALFVLTTLLSLLYLGLFLGLLQSDAAITVSFLVVSGLVVLVFAYPVGSFITRQKPTVQPSRQVLEDTASG